MKTNQFLRIVERFAADGVDGCWEWPMYCHPSGYGHLNYLNRNSSTRAHRLAYELLAGPLQPGEFVLHKCDNPPCFRPDHLRAGTNADNMADMAAKGRSKASNIACSHGHLYVEGSWFYATKDGQSYRACRICKRARGREVDRRRRQRRRAA